jgi:hypothetical protein
MIEEARTHHPAMVAVGVTFFLAFLAIAIATVLSVVADDTPEPATVAFLALPIEVEVLDAHQICNAEACDGEGAVLLSEGRTALTALALVETSLKATGWWEYRCGDDEPCLRRNDLAAEVVPWVAVDDHPGTAAMRSNLDGMQVDQEALVYVRVFRCNVLTPCAERPSAHGSTRRSGVAPAKIPDSAPAKGKVER